VKAILVEGKDNVAVFKTNLFEALSIRSVVLADKYVEDK
jgi:hypothetical protein